MKYKEGDKIVYSLVCTVVKEANHLGVVLIEDVGGNQHAVFEFELARPINKYIFKVDIYGYEKGWGKGLDDTKEFSSQAEAEEFIKEMNAKNNKAVTPDYYTKAIANNF